MHNSYQNFNPPFFNESQNNGGKGAYAQLCTLRETAEFSLSQFHFFHQYYSEKLCKIFWVWPTGVFVKVFAIKSLQAFILIIK